MSTGLRIDPFRAGLLVAAFSGCVDAPGGGPGVTAGGSSSTVAAVVDMTIGTVDGPAESLFGDVTSVATDAAGRVYVADRLGSSVRAFGPDGAFLGWLGRQGDGPGDFDWPNDILVAPDSTLYVRDSNRITRLAASKGAPYPDSVVETWRIPGFANLDSRRARLAGDNYLYPHYSFRRNEPPRFLYLTFTPSGFQEDTLHVPQIPNLEANRTAFYRTGPGGGRMVEGLNLAPFSPGASWDVTSYGTVIASEGDSDVVHEYSASGELIRSIEGPRGTRRPVPAVEREDSLRALSARIDSLPVGLDEVENVDPAILNSEFADSLPSVLSVHWGAGDRIWVQRWPPAGRSDARLFDVLTYNGHFLASVEVPAPLLDSPPPYFGTETVVGVVQDPDTDVHTVVVSRFTLPPETER